ncbi:MAG: hypothetical protein R3C49_15085 [Planctomycetaceae bacterium]
MYSTAGDRQNCDIERQGELLGNSFDEVFVYEGHYKRGRADGETIALFEAGLKRGSRVSRIVPIEGALNACEAALKNLRPGDLLLMQADQVDETLEFLDHFLNQPDNTPDEGNRPNPSTSETAVTVPEEISVMTSAFTGAAADCSGPHVRDAVPQQSVGTI